MLKPNNNKNEKKTIQKTKRNMKKKRTQAVDGLIDKKYSAQKKVNFIIKRRWNANVQ